MKCIEKSIKDMKILPAKEGTCPICAVNHEPELPHNKDSLFYQMTFYQNNGRFPTWKDAMEHCSDEMKALWTHELLERGVEVE
jgi:hypothetical protein